MCVDATAFTMFSNGTVCNGTHGTAGVALLSLNCSCNTSRLLNNPLLLLTVSTCKQQNVHALLYPKVREESFLFSQVKFLKCEKQRKLTRQTHRGSLHHSDQRYWRAKHRLQNVVSHFWIKYVPVLAKVGRKVDVVLPKLFVNYHFEKLPHNYNHQESVFTTPILF